MIPRSYLRKIRQIEVRTNRLAQELLAGAYHSVFKGRGMDFEDVREYQLGDDVRTIEYHCQLLRLERDATRKHGPSRETLQAGHQPVYAHPDYLLRFGTPSL